MTRLEVALRESGAYGRCRSASGLLQRMTPRRGSQQPGRDSVGPSAEDRWTQLVAERIAAKAGTETSRARIKFAASDLEAQGRGAGGRPRRAPSWRRA